jgi:hypothetical protein
MTLRARSAGCRAVRWATKRGRSGPSDRAVGESAERLSRDLSQGHHCHAGQGKSTDRPTLRRPHVVVKTQREVVVAQLPAAERRAAVPSRPSGESPLCRLHRTRPRATSRHGHLPDLGHPGGTATSVRARLLRLRRQLAHVPAGVAPHHGRRVRRRLVSRVVAAVPGKGAQPRGRPAKYLLGLRTSSGIGLAIQSSMSVPVGADSRRRPSEPSGERPSALPVRGLCPCGHPMSMHCHGDCSGPCAETDCDCVGQE